jgi:two-component system response regulator YesN
VKRVLIVDDELPIINGLQMLFKRYFQAQYTVVGTAQSGREAIEKSKLLAPDIVLMDVQMPGLSGLDAIRALSEQGGAKAFILVTAYERFDIAREALSMGVCDYLLKPVSRERLESALQAASNYLDKANSLEEKELETRELQQELAPVVQTAFFYEVCHQRKKIANVALYKQLLNLPSDFGLMGIASFSPNEGTPQALYDRFCTFLRYKTIALAGPLEDGRYCPWFLPIKAPKSIELVESTGSTGSSESAEAEAEAEAFLSLAEANFGALMATGELQLVLGDVRPLDGILQSWDAALKSYIGQKSPSTEEARRPNRETDAQESLAAAVQLDTQFFDAVTEGEFVLAGQILEKMLLGLDPRGDHDAPPRQLYFRAIGALAFAISSLAGAGLLSEATYMEFMNLGELQDLWSKGSYRLFGAGVRSRFQRLQEHATSQGEYSPFVVRALQYIENHYKEPISLETAAQAMGVSAGHLTRLMSNELKKGFARTLIDYRMKKAKELLKKPNVVVRDVSQECGYPDPNYFARLFRRVTGMTPREYAAQASEEDKRRED